MELTISRTIDAPLDKVWEIVGPNYTSAGDWASSVYVSGAREGTPKVVGAPAAGRVCETSLGPFTETIEAYDPARHVVSYSATGAKMPGFMKGLRNTWTLTPQGGGTKASMTLRADIAFPMNLLMGPMMKMQFRKALTETIDDLKVYAETGRPSASKIKADASKKGIAARRAMA
ncbi:SRPBCC family protein [Jannaschia sp. KMU-145]|uniref:SRPBCC family protein n=1 Tax=Jannaschia halovivens TaxID=3388667 RepID=UPI00396B3597